MLSRVQSALSSNAGFCSPSCSAAPRQHAAVLLLRKDRSTDDKMSLIMQRKSKGLEPVLPVVQGTGGDNSGVQPLGDERHFVKVLPRHWKQRQLKQFTLFMYGVFNLCVAHAVISKQARFLILDKFNISSRVDLAAAGGVLFGLEGLTSVLLSFLIFPTFLALLERNINPFRALTQAVTYAVVVPSFAVELGAADGSRLALAQLVVFSAAIAVLNLSTEHYVFYARALSNLNSRTAPKLELLLPYSLSLGASLFVAFAPIYFAALNTTHDARRIHGSVDIVAACIILNQLAVGGWILAPRKMSYNRLEIMSAVCSLIVRVAFIRSFRASPVLANP